jgi:hypothetical protein
MYKRRLVTLFFFLLALVIQALGPLVFEAAKPDHSHVRPLAGEFSWSPGSIKVNGPDTKETTNAIDHAVAVVRPQPGGGG